jgi:hypothetical protein
LFYVARLVTASIRAGARALTASCWPGRLSAGETNAGAFTFIAVNDLHYRESAFGEWFAQVVAAMKESAPQAEFCLLGGDLADEGKPEQLAGLRDAFKLLGMPVHAVPGNHVYLADDDRRVYDELFPKQSNYWFEHRGWQVIGLDSTERTQWKETHISPVTLQACSRLLRGLELLILNNRKLFKDSAVLITPACRQGV